MIIILDASTLINLANGAILASVVEMPDVEFLVSEAVRRESRTVAREIAAAVAQGCLNWVDAESIDAMEYETALATWGLGAGETECFLAALKFDCQVACDDGSARKIIKKHHKGIQLTGSIGLLRMAMAAKLLTRATAFSTYELMKERGGYLPSLSITDL